MTEKTRKPSFAKYTLGEELLNAISHGLGAFLSVVGTVLLLIKAADKGALAITTAAFYGASMIVMYCVSTVYHSLAKNSGKKVMRILDHCFIYALIIGTYAPFTLVAIGGATGIAVFSVVFVAGVVGIVLTAVNMHKFSKFAFICYLAMGWAIIFAIKPLINSLDRYGLLMLILGGAVYTVGAVFYLFGKKKRYIHATWHFFVLAGTVLHFLAIYNSVII